MNGPPTLSLLGGLLLRRGTLRKHNEASEEGVVRPLKEEGATPVPSVS